MISSPGRVTRAPRLHLEYKGTCTIPALSRYVSCRDVDKVNGMCRFGYLRWESWSNLLIGGSSSSLQGDREGGCYSTLVAALGAGRLLVLEQGVKSLAAKT